MVRSTSSLRPISGSILPLRAGVVQVGGVLLEGVAAAVAVALRIAAGIALLPLAALLAARLGQSVRDEIDHVEPGHVLHAEQVGRVRLLLAENRDQHVGDRHFFLAAGLDVEDGALEHPLEAQCGLHVPILPGRQPRRGLVDELLQFGLELAGIRTAGLQDLADLRRIHDRQQQMLDGHEFVACLARTGECVIQAEFEFLTKHRLCLF